MKTLQPERLGIWATAGCTGSFSPIYESIVAIRPGSVPGTDSPDFQPVPEMNTPVTMHLDYYIDSSNPAIQFAIWQMMRL